MEETTYLSAGKTLVTTSRIEIDGQTFAVRNVGSVKVIGGGRPWMGAIVAIIGAASMTTNAFFGGAMLLLGAYLMWQKIAQRELVLITGGGETTAMKSTNGAAVEALRSAIAQAISAR